MTLQFVDSFDHYATADIGMKWTLVASATISAGNGRNATQCMRHSTQNLPGPVKTLGAQPIWVVGVAFKATVLTLVASGGFIAFLDSGTLQCDLRAQTDGTLIVTRNGTTVLGPSSKALTQNTFYFIEFKTKIDPAAGAGTVQVKVNGEVWLSNSGAINTRNTANSSANAIRLGYNPNATSTQDFDDVYICDGVDATATQGAPFNDFLGDCRVKALYAAADGNYTGNWTRNGAGVDADYKAVDEALQDGDTTYLSDNTIDHRSSWTFGSMGTVGTVKAVALNAMARKDDAGTKLLDIFARRTATDYDRNIDFSLLDTYSNHQEIWGTHPDATAWTPTIVNALEAGIRMDT